MDKSDSSNNLKTNINPDLFTAEIDGREVALYVLKNRNGMEVAVTNYGAFIVSVMTPDRNGSFDDVVLGHASLKDYIDSPEPYLGSVIGRYGNRIANGQFTLDGREYRLAVNNGPNSLHGGAKGFNKAVWKVIAHNDNAITMGYLSPDGEEGYPGALFVELTYTLTDDNAIEIDYKASTDKPTILNLTQHSFFNLAGHAGVSELTDVHETRLTIEADFYIPIDETSIPTGEIARVAGTPMDFTRPHTIGERIGEDFEQLVIGKGYDHCYALRKAWPGELRLAALAVEPTSGRTLETWTTEPGVQLYTGNWLGGFEGKYGVRYPERSAFCLETQHFPDSPNKPWFPPVVLRPDETYTQKTVYKFGITK